MTTTHSEMQHHLLGLMRMVIMAMVAELQLETIVDERRMFPMMVEEPLQEAHPPLQWAGTMLETDMVDLLRGLQIQGILMLT